MVKAAVTKGSPVTQLIVGEDLEEYNSDMAEEVVCLNDKLDGYDYWLDESGKAKHQ